MKPDIGRRLGNLEVSRAPSKSSPVIVVGGNIELKTMTKAGANPANATVILTGVTGAAVPA